MPTPADVPGRSEFSASEEKAMRQRGMRQLRDTVENYDAMMRRSPATDGMFTQGELSKPAVKPPGNGWEI